MPDLGSSSQALLGHPAAPSATSAGRSRRWPAVPREDLIGVIVAAVGGALAATFSLQLWHAHLHIPFTYTGDGIFTEVFVKSIVNGGWIFTNHSLGAPLGTQLFDYPLGTDNLHWLIVKLMGIVTSNPSRVLNGFFLLTFPANAIAGYVVFRWMRISVPASVVCAILFTEAPYHLLQSEGHVFLSEYVAVPMGAYLILSVLDGSSWSNIRLSRDRREWRRWLPTRPGLRVLLCVLIGSLGVYYSAFTIVLMTIAGLATAAGHRSLRPLVPAALVVVLIGAMIVLDDAPTIVYRHQHGANAEVAQRQPVESEVFSLNLAELVLPVPGDRIGAFDHLRYRYDIATPVPSAGAESLGLVAALSFLWLCAVALSRAVGVGRAGPRWDRQSQLGFAALITFLTGTFGGISALIAWLITPEIRAWNWISIFISFFALAGLGLVLDALRVRDWARRRRLRGARLRWWWPAALLAVLLFGIYEQSSTHAIPPYSADAASFGSDLSFVQKIQSVVPPGAAIFELPYVPFPENPPVVRMTDYDEARGYVLTTDNLRWSYGAMKGRPADWASQVQSMPIPTLLDGLAASGFSGVYIDRFGYADSAQQLSTQVQAALGAGPIGSFDGRLLFFNLQPLSARLRSGHGAAQLTDLRDAVLHPPEITWGSGFYTQDLYNARWALADAVATVDNRDRAARRVEFYADVQTLRAGRFSLKIDTPDGTAHTFVITHRPRPIAFAFMAPPGTQTVTFTSNAPAGFAPGDPRSLAVHYSSPMIAAAGVTPFLPGSPATR